MSSHQSITIIGHLGQDPVLHEFENGGKVCNISVATTETWKDKETQEKKSWTEWHRIVFRGKQAELADKYLKKGDQCLVVGKNRTRSYEKDGVKHYTTEIQAEKLTFMSAGNGNNSQAANDQNNQEVPTQDPIKTESKPNQEPNVVSEENNDLPF